MARSSFLSSPNLSLDAVNESGEESKNPFEVREEDSKAEVLFSPQDQYIFMLT